jgi:aspartyl protease family protein
MFRSTFLTVAALIFVGYGASSFLATKVAQPRPQQSDADAAASAPAPAESVAPRSGGYGEMQIAQDRSGNYLTEAEIDGHLIRMVVDTGATYVCLTNEDASAIGIRPDPMDYRYRTMTANGTGVAAKVRIASLRLGQMEVNNVEAFVMPPSVLRMSLLGMSALNQLGKVEISGGTLVLRQ